MPFFLTFCLFKHSVVMIFVKNSRGGEGQHDQHFVKNKFVKNRVGGRGGNLNLDILLLFFRVPLIDDCHITFILSCLIVSNTRLCMLFVIIFHTICLTTNDLSGILDTTDTAFCNPDNHNHTQNNNSNNSSTSK